MGIVNVTVVVVSAHCVQTVTVVVKPLGRPLVSVGQTKELTVALGVTVMVVVRVYGRVVKPVGQISTYEVTKTVVVTSGATVSDAVVVVGATVTVADQSCQAKGVVVVVLVSEVSVGPTTTLEVLVELLPTVQSTHVPAGVVVVATVVLVVDVEVP